MKKKRILSGVLAAVLAAVPGAALAAPQAQAASFIPTFPISTVADQCRSAAYAGCTGWHWRRAPFSLMAL